MKKLFGIFVLALIVLLPGQVQARDMMRLACNDFVNASPGEMEIVMVWIDGYLSHKSGDTGMDEATIARLKNELLEFCRQNPNAAIGQAISD